jgi:threonine synthase
MPFRCQSCETSVATPTAVCDVCGGFVRYVEDDKDRLCRSVEGVPTSALPTFGADVNMGEGSTPLIELEGDGEALPDDVYGKLESLNPTCSFKDRGSSLAVSAVTDDDTSWEALVVASTGNTAPSVSAYAARAGVPCAVLVPDGTSLSKLSQVAAHGIDIFTVEGTFSDCFGLAEAVSDERVLNATAVYSANPFVASANRTVAFELVDQLGRAPDWVTVPVGAGPLLGGTYFGFEELCEAGIIDEIPRFLCVQARGCHPIVRAVERNEPVRPWTGRITTTVGAIADPLVGYAADGEQTRRVVEASDGTAVALDDEAIHGWTDRLAATDGVYAEPASAASVAAIEAADAIDGDDTVVALVTGHGLKESNGEKPSARSVGRDESAIRDALLVESPV